MASWCPPRALRHMLWAHPRRWPENAGGQTFGSTETITPFTNIRQRAISQTQRAHVVSSHRRGIRPGGATGAECLIFQRKQPLVTKNRVKSLPIWGPDEQEWKESDLGFVHKRGSRLMYSFTKKVNFAAEGKYFQWRIPRFYRSSVKVEAIDVGG